MTELCFWLSALFIAYTYLGYPLGIVLWSKFRAKPPLIGDDHTPEVMVVIAAYNERHRIVARVQNLLQQDYPPDKLQVLVVSDGSGDGTDAVIEALAHPRVRVIHYTPNRGKAIAINTALDAVDSEIVVFADARQQYAARAVRKLVAPFADAKVGATSGELMLRASASDSSPQAVGLYWKYEKAIRLAESGVDSMVGATGAIFAIRRRLFRPLPADTLLDDVLTPMNVIKQGYRVYMVKSAEAYDVISGSLAEEFRRKVRTLAGNYQLMRAAPWINDPRQNRLFFQWASHKVARLMAPFFLLSLFISSWLASGSIYWFAGVLQTIFYLLAVFGWFGPRRGRNINVINAASSFFMLNVAAAAGLFLFLFGDPATLWKKH